MTLQLADRTFRKPAGVLIDVPIVVEKFAYPVDFVVLEMEDSSEAVILGRPFLAIAGAIINVKQDTISLSCGDDEIIFNMKDPTHLPHCSYRCFAMDVVDSCILETYERCEAQPEIDEDLLVRPCLNAVMQTSIIEQAEASTEEVGQYALNLQPNSVVELKPLPAHLTYQFLEPEKKASGDNKCRIDSGTNRSAAASSIEIQKSSWVFYSRHYWHQFSCLHS
jgi:hypothetical protein